MLAIAVIFLCGAYTLFYHAASWYQPLRVGLSGFIAIFGCWTAFRLINWAPFADFLVSVESEMMKVSWPGRSEMYTSTIVMLIVMFLLVVVVYVFDIFWWSIFHYLFKIV